MIYCIPWVVPSKTNIYIHPCLKNYFSDLIRVPSSVRGPSYKPPSVEYPDFEVGDSILEGVRMDPKGNQPLLGPN